MDDRNVLQLLIFCNELDGRHAPNELKVRAWADVFNQGAAGMTLEFAMDVAKRHHATVDQMITPAVFVRSWKTHRAAKEAAFADAEAHCRRQGCACTHSGDCDRGWLDRGDAVAPCPVCRPTLAGVLAEVSPLGRRTDYDYVRIRSHAG